MVGGVGEEKGRKGINNGAMSGGTWLKVVANDMIGVGG
jgi:hypothetical protein